MGAQPTDFEHDAMWHTWVHPETGVTITCEQMPDELVPTVTESPRTSTAHTCAPCPCQAGPTHCKGNCPSA
jgi:hypothetical protein